MASKRYYQILLLFLLSLSLLACGFKLRGIMEVPVWLNHVALLAEDGNRELFPKLRAQLEANNIAITEDLMTAKYWLVLLRTIRAQQLASVGSTTNSRQYQLIYKVDFLLKTKEGKIILPPAHISISRQLTINNNKVLGSEDEGRLMLEEMQRDIVIQLLNRLSSVPYKIE